MTVLRMTCVLEKLSIGMRLRILDDLRMRGKPHVGVGADVTNQLFEDPHARPVAADVRVHRELEEAAFAMAPSNSRLKMSNTSLGGVYGRNPAKRFMMK